MSAHPEFAVKTVIFRDDTDWHGTSWEFFDEEADAASCCDCHIENGNQSEVIPFHAGLIGHLGKPGIPQGPCGCPSGPKGERGEPGIGSDT